jgi:hypothetical protein
MATGIITTINVVSGYTPGYLAVDACSNVYYVSSNAQTIRMYNATSMTAFVVAGGGVSSYGPTNYRGTSVTLSLNAVFSSLRTDSVGNVYFSDILNHRVFKMNGYGTSCRARTSSPTPRPTMSPASAGTPTAFPTYPLLTPTAAPTNIYGQILNFAGTGASSSSGDGSMATSAYLNIPLDIALDTVNKLLYIADSKNCGIRVVSTVTGPTKSKYID